jgi:nucleotide-binding universal stress UspA family protein
MYHKILVPLDGSNLAECVMPHVEEIAKLSKATIELIYVVEPVDLPTHGGIALTVEDLKQIETHAKIDAQTYLHKIVQKMKSKGFTAHSKILRGKAADSLVDYINQGNFDLMIMATHGRSGITRWIWGSVAERILHFSTIPILIIRPPKCSPGSGTR